MKNSCFNPINKSILYFILNLCFLVTALGQQHIGPHTINSLGPENMIFTPPAQPLQESTKMEQGKSNASFVSGVGGVSFDQVALPANGISVNSLHLSYNPEDPDGRRAHVSLNEKSVTMNIPDWMLVPIAKYANSPYYSCVTLFGKLEDNSLAKEVTDNGGRVINYHPAFENTLLGIRLLYMDMLVGYPFTSDLPRNANNEYVLGAGENTPDINDNKQGAYLLSQHIILVQNQFQTTFRSYVISDYTQDIKFNIVDSALNLSGTPYFLCWRYKQDNSEYDINAVANDLSSKYNKKIEELNKSEGYNAVQEWLINKTIEVAEKYNGNYSFYTDGTFVDLVKLTDRQQQIAMLKKYDIKSLFNMILQTEVYMDGNKVIYLKEFSDKFSSRPELLRDANPAVYNAVVTTMRYAAFFRYVKENFPEEWVRFYNMVSLQKIAVVYTPTVMCGPENKALIEKIKWIQNH
jgi:hypothetical protein